MKGLAYFLSGVAVGAAACIYLTSQKGYDDRRRLADCLRRKGLLPVNEIDILVDEVIADPEAGFGEAVRPDEKSAEGNADHKEK